MLSGDSVAIGAANGSSTSGGKRGRAERRRDDAPREDGEERVSRTTSKADRLIEMNERMRHKPPTVRLKERRYLSHRLPILLSPPSEWARP
jgi:hypothetical protein